MTPTVSLSPLSSAEVRLDPHPFYAELHRQGPACRVEPGSSRYQVVVHGYDAAARALRDNTLKVVDTTYLGREYTWEEDPTQAIFMNSMMFTNDPRHSRMRNVFNQVFTARRVARLEPMVADVVNGLVEGMAEAGIGGTPIDYMAMFAYPVPSDVMGEMLGVPKADRNWYRDRAGALGKVLELGGSTPENVARADAASRELAAYFTDLCDKRRTDPADDLISALVAAMDAEQATLSPLELLANLVVLFNAGFVTTTNLIGNGLTLLLDHPNEMKALRAAPELAPAYVEEMLRMEIPTHFVIRWASEDTELAGVPVARGDRVLILLGAANRDPVRFPDPNAFDPARSGTVALSFGAGVHFCLGAALARLEAQHAFTALLDRFDQIRLDREPAAPQQLMLRGYDELWVTIQ